MNILEVLRNRVAALPTGPHIDGLRAVLRHIEVATNHLSRGQQSGDETSFTDAIYRTNQGFEGSLKEAYRVLAGKDPTQVKPYEIEQYFQKEGQLRPRVLAQLVSYRKDWRNPSTHDHRLDFDEDEALLAIVSVFAFAVVLIDQIAEKLSFEAARAAAASLPSAPTSADGLSQTLDLLKRYALEAEPVRILPQSGGAQITGSLAGYLSATMPSNRIRTDVPLGPSSSREADLVIDTSNQQIVVEVKGLTSGALIPRILVDQAVEQVSTYAKMLGTEQAIVYFHPSDKGGEIAIEERRTGGNGIVVHVVRPKVKRDG